MLLALSRNQASRLGLEQHRRAVVEPLVDIRSRMVRAASRGQPVYPIIQELRWLVLEEAKRTIATLLGFSPAISPGEIFAYDAGAFAKGTCIPGSDLDLNVTYSGDNLAPFRHFEDGLKCALGFVFDISPFAVQHNDLGIASENVDFVRWLRGNRWGPLTENVRFRDRAISSFARALKMRGRLQVFGMDINMLVNASAIRDPHVVYLWENYALQRFAAGDPHWGFFLDFEPVFGAFQVGFQRQAFISFELDQSMPDIRANADSLFGNLITPPPANHNGEAPKPLSGSIRLEEVMPHFKCGRGKFKAVDGYWGYRTAQQLLFVIGALTADSAETVPRNFGQHLASPHVASVLGQGLREELFDSINWLMSARSVASIFLNGGVDRPTLGESLVGRAYGSDPLGLTLTTLGLANLRELKRAIEYHRGVIRRAIAMAQSNFS